MLTRKVLKSGASEILFPAIWCRNLQNSEGRKTSYKNAHSEGGIDMRLRVPLISKT